MRGVQYDSKEYERKLYDVIDVLWEVALKYINNEKYEIWGCFEAETENQGLPLEYDRLFVDVYVVDKGEGDCSDTESQEYVGSVEYAHSGYRFDGGLYATVYFYSKKKIRKDVREIFEEWAREKIEEGEEEFLNPKVVRRLSKLKEVRA